MSSFRTHMLIGAVGGLGLVQALGGGEGALLAKELAMIGQPVGREIALIALCAVLATWPDLDEPGSWLSRRLVETLGLVGAALGAFVIFTGSYTNSFLLAMPVLLALLFAGFGWLWLKILRSVAGGHRQGTHGLIAPGIWAAFAIYFGFAGQTLSLYMSLLIIYGWVLHIIGDVVTPSGWRPLAPWDQDAVKLPKAISRNGEGWIAIAALVVGAILLGARLW